jgi:hypothetical protein
MASKGLPGWRCTATDATGATRGLKCQDLRLQELLEYREQLIMSSSIQVGRETVNVYNSLCSPKLFIHP